MLPFKNCLLQINFVVWEIRGEFSQLFMERAVQNLYTNFHESYSRRHFMDRRARCDDDAQCSFLIVWHCIVHA